MGETITIEPWGSKEEWTHSDLHCLACGKRSLWSDGSSEYICRDCKNYMYLPGKPIAITPEMGMYFQRLWCLIDKTKTQEA